MTGLVPTCVWRIADALVLRLDEAFGEPLDTYVNGSQVWLREDGPAGLTLEWRLHPVAGYVRPKGMATEAVFERTSLALGRGEAPPVPVAGLWDGLECFAAYGDEVEPAVLAASASAALGLPPDASGLVDHDRIGDAWERTGGRVSIVELLIEELSTPAS